MMDSGIHASPMIPQNQILEIKDFFFALQNGLFHKAFKGMVPHNVPQLCGVTDFCRLLHFYQR